MASHLTVSAERLFRYLPTLCLSAALLAWTGGCQNDGEIAGAGKGLSGAALAPRSVEDYARRRNISNDQARRELQDAVSKRDADEAVKNLDDAGITTTQ